jgi:hypothetical protein
MKYLMLILACVAGLVCVDNADAARFGRNRSASVTVQRGNVRVEKVVVNGHNHNNARVVERVVVDNRHSHNNARVVERVVVDQPVYRDVVVERVVVDNHGHTQKVRSVERVRVR